MNTTITKQLNEIELNNNSLQDICTSLVILSKTDLSTPQQYKYLLAPLVEFMGELLDSTSNAVMEIDRLNGK